MCWIVFDAPTSLRAAKDDSYGLPQRLIERKAANEPPVEIVRVPDCDSNTPGAVTPLRMWGWVAPNAPSP